MPLRTVALLAFSLIGTGCRQQPKQQIKTTEIGWRPIGTWSGSGSTQTESFNIESGLFRVKWETKNEKLPGEGTFKAQANSAVSGRFIAPVVEHRGAGSGTGYVSDDPRPFFLVIESKAVDWTVTVEEGVAGVAQ